MIIFFKILFTLLISMASFGQEIHILKNDREKNSFFNKSIYQREINLLTITNDKSFIKNLLIESLILSKKNSQCLLDINFQLGSILPKNLSSFQFYLLARRYNYIDDFFLEQALKIAHINLDPNALRLSEYSSDSVSELSEFIKASKRDCVLNSWQILLQKIQGKKKNLSQLKVKNILRQQLKEAAFTKPIENEVETLIALKLQNESFTSLKTYLQTKKILRQKYPIKETDETSDFVIDKVRKIKRSKRNVLFSTYNAKAIEKMSEVMVRLIEHVESPKMELNIFNNDDSIIRTVELDPMDRFRFAIRYLRTQMNELQLDVDFKGRIPSYDDVILSAFETNIIKSSDLNELASLEEIWNPTQTFWDKSLVWVRLFVPIASIVIPPPYNVVASIALIIIELTTKKPEPGYEHALFMEI